MYRTGPLLFGTHVPFFSTLYLPCLVQPGILQSLPLATLRLRPAAATAALVLRGRPTLPLPFDRRLGLGVGSV